LQKNKTPGVLQALFQPGHLSHQPEFLRLPSPTTTGWDTLATKFAEEIAITDLQKIQTITEMTESETA
jgi:hypothetical protein